MCSDDPTFGHESGSPSASMSVKTQLCVRHFINRPLKKRMAAGKFQCSRPAIAGCARRSDSPLLLARWSSTCRYGGHNAVVLWDQFDAVFRPSQLDGIIRRSMAYPLERCTDMRRSRLIVGLILIAVAALMFVFGKESYSTAGVISLLVLGLVSIAISRRK